MGGGRGGRERLFFFKQKAAYELKECDWSPDVCSSDLGKLIGKTTTKNTKGNLERKLRRYDIPAGLLKPGRNILAFADDTWGAGGVRPAGEKRQKKRLENVTAYLRPEGVRYIHGLYLDAPGRLDDPYRYLRW